MKKYLFIAVAAIAALSSCSSDNDLLTGETGKKALTFTATMEGSATRATYDSGSKCASWEVGDQISVNGKTYNAQEPGTTTTFKVATEGQEATGNNYTAYFPATLYNNGTPTLPSTVSETWADGKFNMPMYATSTNTELAFKNLCGVLKITVNSDQIAAVKKIRVSSANLAVSGAFNVNGNAAKLTNASNKATLTVTYTNPVTTTAGGVVFYVAIPAQTYQELKIELSADGTNFTKSMTTKSGVNIVVERSKIYPITFANQQYSVTFKSSDFTYNRSMPSTMIDAKNGDVTIMLNLKDSNYRNSIVWKTDANGTIYYGYKDGWLDIVRSKSAGVTITRMVYEGSSGNKATYTGDRNWDLTISNKTVMNGSTNLGDRFVS